MYGGFATGSPEMGKIVTDWHCDRLQSLIETSKGTVICGGKIDRKIKYVEPTIIVNPNPKSPVMEEEIFGPILPILSFQNIRGAADIINSKEKPLAVYYFGKSYSNENKDYLLDWTSSGAFVVNEAVI